MLRRPQLAWPFTIVPRADAVWLIAGEDIRFTVRTDGPCEWLPDLLRACDGRHGFDELVIMAPAESRDQAREILGALAGERIVIEGRAIEIPVRAATPGVPIEGRGRLAELLRRGDPARPVRVFAQDELDLATARAMNVRCLGERTRWIWVSIGPGARAFVGPMFVPEVGPCLACLLDRFRALSPVPEIYDVLAIHSGSHGPSMFPDPGLALVGELVSWKLSLVDRQPAQSALYTLHVVEAESLEVSSHAVLADPECAVCGS